jgi:hypothetical protein
LFFVPLLVAITACAANQKPSKTPEEIATRLAVRMEELTNVAVARRDALVAVGSREAKDLSRLWRLRGEYLYKASDLHFVDDIRLEALAAVPSDAELDGLRTYLDKRLPRWRTIPRDWANEGVPSIYSVRLVNVDFRPA